MAGAVVHQPYDFFAFFVLASFGLVRRKERWSRGSLHCLTASTKFFRILEGRLRGKVNKLSVFCPCSVIQLPLQG